MRRALAQLKQEHQCARDEQRIWLEREIFERQQTEKALRESEQRLETAMLGSPVTLFSQDGGLRYTWMYNPVADWPMDRVIGQRDEDLFGPVDGARLSDLKKAVLQSGTPRQEAVTLHIDGTQRWFKLNINPLRDECGRVVGVICASIDITDVKQLENRIAESEARYRAIVEAYDGMLYICSPDYTLEFMNAKLAARSAGTGVGGKCFKVLHGLDQPCPWCSTDTLQNGGKISWDIQSPLDGRWYHIVNTPMQRADGTPARMGTIIDITERKEAERHRDELAMAVQKTQHLESMARLTGNIAHHFNNQLTVILGNADLARSELPAGHALQVYLDDIRHAAEHAARLSSEMLKCSGHALTEKTPTDLQAFLESLRALINVIAAPRIRLEVRPADRLPAVLIDPRLIQQVVLNLVTNSVEAIGDRAGTLVLETGVCTLDAEAVARMRPHGPPHAGPYVFLKLADTGGGIPDEIIPRLFDPFASTKGVGRGLGLPVALGIAETHGGGIVIVSTPEKGVVATLYLPALTAGQPASV